MLSNPYQLLTVVHSEAETGHLATALADTLEPGAVLILTGELGTGKTTLIKHVGQSLGIDPADVRSPTFTIVHEYRHGRVPLIHMDVYRLGDADEFEAMGGHEYLDTNQGMVAIEWGEFILDALEPEWLQLRIDHGADGLATSRSVWARSEGASSSAWLERVRKRLGRENG